MILINKNSSNNVVLTLTELIIGTDPYDFLFEFINDTTGETKYFTTTDISPATSRYNQFTIIETSTENLYTGRIELNPTGYWSYKIYQMPQSSPPSIDPDDAIGILEIGKVLVKGPDVTIPTYTNNDTKNNFVYE